MSINEVLYSTNAIWQLSTATDANSCAAKFILSLSVRTNVRHRASDSFANGIPSLIFHEARH